MVANFKLILLKLLLVFFRRKIKRLKSRRERRKTYRMLSLQLLVEKYARGSVTRFFFELLSLAAVLC
jgi:hypothetical protein